MNNATNAGRSRGESGAEEEPQANRQNVPGSEQGDTPQAPGQGEKDEGGPGAQPELPDTEDTERD
ncbi:MAG TPA: hypothetical protein VK063_08075 [Beutenbergiaceae bacterium]|nr:hypothetical protein [Beutenbergiaceae bacterium]